MPDLRKLRARGPRRRPPRVRQPDGVRLEYYRTLKAILAYAHALVRDRLLVLLPELVAARSDAYPLDGINGGYPPSGMRTDANPGRRVNRKVDQISAAFYRRFPHEKLEKLARRVALETDARSRVEVLRQAKALVGVDLPTVAAAGLTDAIRDFSAENVALIKSIPDTYFGDVEKVLTRGLNAGQRAPAIAAELEERLGVAEDRARLIARDQVGKFFSSLNETRHRGLGLNRYVWRTSNDERVRPEHAELNGQVFSYDDPPVVDGEAVNPGDAILCRCWADPVLDDDQI